MNLYYFCPHYAEVAQLAEHQLPKLRVAGSNPVFRSGKGVDCTIVGCRFSMFGFEYQNSATDNRFIADP